MRKLHTHEAMLFALLRASLHQKETETSFFSGVSPEDWKACYLLACRQGVMALAWDGVWKLPDALMPPKTLKITWGMAVEAYEERYRRYCRTIDELTEYYMSKGIVPVQLKGVGLSAYYPNPMHREGGDIDIFTYSNKKDVLTDAEANRLADQLMEGQGIKVDRHSRKHSNFYYKGIPIENHKTFVDVGWYRIAPQVDGLLKKMLVPQSTYLMRGENKCLTPPECFNVLFVAFHAAQHYGSGLALHHLCDWAMVLKRCGDSLPDELTDRKFRKAVAAFTLLCNRYLGSDGKENKEAAGLAEEMLEEILYPKFVIGSVPVTGKWNILSYKFRRFRYVHGLNNQVLEWPMWKRVWESVVKKLCHPETIFKTFSE